MPLAARLVLAFGLVATLSVAGLGWTLREDRVTSETERFAREVHAACDQVVAEISRQAESDRKLLAGACQSGELVDRALVWVQAGLDDSRRVALSRLVPEERLAFDLDELVLATVDGEPLGIDPVSILPTSRALVAAALDGTASHGFRFEPSPAFASSVSCVKRGGGHGVVLVGVRHLGPVADRLARTFDVKVALGAALAPGPGRVRASCAVPDGSGAKLEVVVDKSTNALDENLARIDRSVLLAGLASTALALVLAILLGRNLSRPISRLAAEAQKVASGEARPLAVRAPGEIGELARAFDKMLLDLETTRASLQAASRLAAWREVARSVAHEVKNPLAPIRTAVETLRRLRERASPEFDAYFDEATRTVLTEVHRISDIVTEFARFARLPTPKPEAVDLAALAGQVVRMHAENAQGAKVRLEAERGVPNALADRDQIVQLLTNLVQNGLEAVAAGEGEVVVTVESGGAGQVAVTVSDNGPGIAPEVASQLFEPYVTTKPRGTGLGLAIARRIAVEHQGDLRCVPTAGGRGATFRLVVPRASVAPGNEAPSA